MKMNKTFTRIPQRSYNAFIGRRKVTFDAVMAALSVDPLEAEDAFQLLGTKGVPRSLKDFADRGRSAYWQALETISQWMRYPKSEASDARMAIEVVSYYDQRLSIWLACQAARETLRFRPKNEDVILHLIETTEKSVRTGVSAAERKESEDLFREYTMSFDTAYYASKSIADGHALHSARSAERAFLVDGAPPGTYASASFAGKAVWEAAECAVVPVEGPLWRSSMDAELSRLRGVLADACLSYPVIP